MSLTFERFQRMNDIRNPEVFPMCAKWDVTDWGCALAGETGELCNVLKKIKRGDEISREEVMEEVGGILTYAALLCSHQGIRLGEAAAYAFNDVSERRGSPYRMEP